MTRQTGDRWPEDAYMPDLVRTSEPVCDACGLDSPFWIFDSCKACAAAYVIAVPAPWDGNRKWYASTAECAEFEREVAKQTEALAHVARACA